MKVSSDDDSWKRGGVIRRDFRATHDDVVLPQNDHAAYRGKYAERFDKFYPLVSKRSKKKVRPCKKMPHQWGEWGDLLLGGRGIGIQRTCDVCKKTEEHYQWSSR